MRKLMTIRILDDINMQFMQYYYNNRSLLSPARLPTFRHLQSDACPHPRASAVSASCATPAV